MNDSPFFSILTPTKNRSKLIFNAIESTIRQTFQDFELVIVDNDDDESTKQVVDKFLYDKRLRYLKTGGFNMPNNWQYALENARGDYIMFLTDRMMFSSKYSLQKIYTNIKKHKAKIVSWMWGHYDESSGNIYTFNETGNISYFVSLKSLIKSYLVGEWAWSVHRLPRGVNSCLHKDILKELLDKYEKICIPCSPDYSMGLITALHYFDEYVLHIDSSIILSSFYREDISNGNAAFADYNKLLNYLKSYESEVSLAEIMKKTYLQNYVAFNTLYYDLFNAVEITGKNHLISWKNVNMVFYFTEIYKLIEQLKNNPLKKDWLNDWQSKISQQPNFIQERVRKNIDEFHQSLQTKSLPSLLQRAYNFTKRKLISLFPKQETKNSVQLQYNAIPFLEKHDDKYKEYCLSIIDF